MGTSASPQSHCMGGGVDEKSFYIKDKAVGSSKNETLGHLNSSSRIVSVLER